MARLLTGNPRLLFPLAATIGIALLAASPRSHAGELAMPEGQSLHLQTELFVALFNDAAEYSNIAGGFGYGGRATWRVRTVKKNWFGLFAQFERNYWLSSEIELDVVPGVIDFGGGVEYLFFGGRLRSSVAAGSSTLVFDTAFHDKGTTGYFIDIRPACLRWSPLDWLVVELCVINFSMMAPVVDEMTIRKIEYRTILTLEVPL